MNANLLKDGLLDGDLTTESLEEPEYILSSVSELFGGLLTTQIVESRAIGLQEGVTSSRRIRPRSSDCGYGQCVARNHVNFYETDLHAVAA